MSDEDEETNSLENDPIATAFGNLQVDDKNANGGAHGRYTLNLIILYLLTFEFIRRSNWQSQLAECVR